MGLKFLDWVKAVIQSRIAVYEVICVTIVNIMINLTLLNRMIQRVTLLYTHKKNKNKNVSCNDLLTLNI